MDGVQVQCGTCVVKFCICRRCWRGQKYCSVGCSKEGRRLSRIEAQRKYRQSRRGLLNQSQSQRRNRSKIKTEKIVSDHSTKVEVDSGKRVHELWVCACCGEGLDRLVRLTSSKQFSIRRNFQI